MTDPAADLDGFMNDYPFLSLVTCNSEEHLGIVSNRAGAQTSMYVYDRIRTPELRKEFLDLGESWWWETNRQIPIGIVYRGQFGKFAHSMRRFASRGVTFQAGPETSLSELNRKRSKRRSIPFTIRPRDPSARP